MGDEVTLTLEAYGLTVKEYVVNPGTEIVLPEIDETQAWTKDGVKYDATYTVTEDTTLVMADKATV